MEVLLEAQELQEYGLAVDFVAAKRALDAITVLRCKGTVTATLGSLASGASAM